MTAEFDHVFICTSQGADEAAGLAAFGLTEGTANVHSGQGTACRRFFFRNGYLELLWVSDPAEAESAPIQPTHLWERWTGRANGGCPIGLGFRPRAYGVGTLPFPAWDYRPPYFPETLSIQVATNAAVLTEPMLFYLSFSQRPDAYPSGKRQELTHAAGLREITRIELVSPPAGNRSPAMEALSRTTHVQFRTGPEYLVELGFDGELEGQSADFRPSLPLVFRW